MTFSYASMEVWNKIPTVTVKQKHYTLVKKKHIKIYLLDQQNRLFFSY